MKIGMCVLSYLCSAPTSLSSITNVIQKKFATTDNFEESRLSGSIVEFKGLRYWNKRHEGDNVIFTSIVSNQGVTMSRRSKDPPGMVHLKLEVGQTMSLIDIKIHASGKCIVTLSHLPSEFTNDSKGLISCTKEIHSLMNSLVPCNMVNNINLIRAQNKLFREGSFESKPLMTFLSKEFAGVKHSNTEAWRIQAFSRENPSFSVIFQRRGTVQVIAADKEGSLNVSEVFSFIDRVQQLVQSLQKNAKVNNIYNKTAVNITRCNGHPVPDPVGFHGVCPEGYYIIPSKTGEPCCKPLPKYYKTAAFRKMVQKKYRNRSLKLPTSIRKIIGAPSTSPTTNRSRPTPSTPVSKKIRVRGSGSFAARGKQQIYKNFFIDDQECYKVPAKVIKEHGKRLGIDVKHLRTAAKICREIDVLTRNRARHPLVARTDSAPVISKPKNKTPRDLVVDLFEPGKCKKGTSKQGFYTIAEVQGMAKILGLRGYSKLSKEDLCLAVSRAIKNF